MPKDITCKYVKENLSAYYDKELDEKEFKKIQLHLRGCITCRREFSDMAKMSYRISNSFAALHLPKIELPIYDVSRCFYVVDNMDSYIDKELPKRELSIISEHILHCIYCREDYENKKNIKKVVGRYFDVFKIPKNIINYKKIIAVSFLASRKKVVTTSVACLVGAIFLMLLSAVMFSPDNVNPPSVATQEIPLEKVIPYENEIKINNIKYLERLEIKQNPNS